MPEQPDEKLHRNRPFSLPTMGGGPQNCFSRGDFLIGKSPVLFGPGQAANIFTQSEVPKDAVAPARPTPELWPTDWPMAGRLLTVPRVVIFSDFIAWPEFWSNCVFDYPRDVIGEILSTGRLTNYYYLDQWNTGQDWRTSTPPGTDQAEYRYEQQIGTVSNPNFSQHQSMWNIFRQAKKILAAQDNPVYAVLPNWIPQNEYAIPTQNLWRAWMNDNIYWPGFGQANTDVIHGHSGCDIFYTGGNRGRVHPDPNAPNWRSDCDAPPNVPCLTCPTPFFGTNVLHMWFGHWCMNWGGSNLLNFETFPLSPAGTQTGPLLNGTYLGSPISTFDGKRLIWRDLGLNYGYIAGYKALLNNYAAQLGGASDQYKTNFWKYRDFGIRFVPWQQPWSLPLSGDAVKLDQKWCPGGQFYFGFTFAEFQQMITNEDNYAIDYSAETNNVKFANVVTRTPDSPAIRQAIIDFLLFYTRVQAYYADPITGLDGGTKLFLQAMIDQYDLADYNVSMATNPGDLFTVDGLVAYVNDYFSKHP